MDDKNTAHLIRTLPMPIHTLHTQRQGIARTQHPGAPSRYYLQVIEPTFTNMQHSAARQPNSKCWLGLSGGVKNALDHVTSTATSAQNNNPKVPQIWAWGGEPTNRTGFAPPKKEETIAYYPSYDTFPYVGNWRARARYRYLVQMASEGTGFVAVGREESCL